MVLAVESLSLVSPPTVETGFSFSLAVEGDGGRPAAAGKFAVLRNNTTLHGLVIVFGFFGSGSGELAIYLTDLNCFLLRLFKDVQLAGLGMEVGALDLW